jgi:hypothetical protein
MAKEKVYRIIDRVSIAILVIFSIANFILTLVKH